MGDEVRAERRCALGEGAGRVVLSVGAGDVGHRQECPGCLGARRVEAGLDGVDLVENGERLGGSRHEEKWRPATRETADHSLPYNVARALIDGELTPTSFALDRLGEPGVVALMAKTAVFEDPALTAVFPQRLPNRVTVTLTSGAHFSAEVGSGRPGAMEIPESALDVDAEFRRTAREQISGEAQETVLAFVAALEQQRDFVPLFATLQP